MLEAAEPDRAGARRDPAALHAAPASRRRSRARSSGWSTGSPTSTTTSTTRCGPACSLPATCRRRRSRCSGRRGRGGSTRSCTTSSSTPRRPGTSCRATRSAARCCALRSFMFEHVYLGPIARAEHAQDRARAARAVRLVLRAPRGAAAGPRTARDEADRVIDYLAGMTDRFAIRAWTERSVPQGLLQPDDGRATTEPTRSERVRDAVDFVELVGARTELRQRRRSGATRGCARSTTSGRRRSASTRSRSSTTASAAARAATSSSS